MNKSFEQEIVDLFKDMAIAALTAIKMTLKDFYSFRNRLIGYICLVGIIVLLSEKAQAGVQVAIFTILGTVVSYYFKQRNDSQKIKKKDKKSNEKDN